MCFKTKLYDSQWYLEYLLTLLDTNQYHKIQTNLKNYSTQYDILICKKIHIISM